MSKFKCNGTLQHKNDKNIYNMEFFQKGLRCHAIFLPKIKRFLLKIVSLPRSWGRKDCVTNP